MLANKKNVFWEALLLAGVVFVLGLLLGIFVESSRLGTINNYYSQAEISLVDSMALSNVITSGASCSNLISSNVQFANSIYDEAKILENYESSGKITNDMKIAHQKYDLLRTILWQNVVKIQKQCPGQFDYIVYLYNYLPQNLAQKAEENVWSEILSKVKQDNGNRVILIPIAVDSNLSSLNYMISSYNVTSFPAVVINGNQTLYNMQSASDIEKYLI